MFIAKAYAQATESLAELEGGIPNLPEAPSAGELIIQNLMIVGVLVFLFYILLILPQQRRFKEHHKMLSELKKGDKVITGGGLVGTVEKILEEKDEILINLGDVKVTALRSTIHQKDDPRLRKKPANDAKEDKGAKSAKSASKSDDKGDKKDKKK
ncbi:MAG: preprotein translocase subunit YajC [Alphaproteobacteria bacterium]